MKWLTRNKRTILQLVFIWILYATIFFLWKFQVEPVPSPEKYRSFYFPFLNYLTSSIIFPLSYFPLAELVMVDEAPLGLLLPAKIISLLGLQKLFLNEAYLFIIFLLLPCGLVPFFFKLSVKSRWLFALLIFYFPPIQILLKTFSPEAICILYHLIGFFFMNSYLVRKDGTYLIGFFIAVWLSAVTDITGFLFLLILFKVCILHSLVRPAELLKLTSIFLIIILSVIPWYYIDTLNFIQESVNSDLVNLITLSSLFYSFLIFIKLRYPNVNQNKIRLPRIFHNFILLGICLLLYIYLLLRDPEVISSFGLGLFSIFTGYGLLIMLSYRYGRINFRGFSYLACVIFFMKGVILYEYLPGKSSSFITLPLILILIRSYLDTPNHTKNVGLLTIFFICSNFCPPSLNLQQSFGDRGFRLVMNGTKSLHFNPLGWQNSEIYLILEQIESIFSGLEIITRDSLCAFDNLHFHSRLLLNIPRSFQKSTPALKRLDDLPEGVLSNFLLKYEQLGDGLFDSWLTDEKFTYLIEGVKPWEINHSPAAPLAIIKNNPTRKGELGMSLSHAFFNYLNKTGKMNHYFLKHSIPQDNPRVNLYISKNITKVKNTKPKMNLELSRIGLHFDIDLFNQTPPKWFHTIHPNIQNEIRSREAVRIHDLGKQYLDQANYVQAYKHLRKAKQLDPDNSAVKSDYEKIQSQLPAALNKFLEN